METISWSDFEKVEFRVGRIVAAEPFPEARKPAYILHLDFGEEIGLRKSSAQITHHYQPEQLIGKQVIAVVNFRKSKSARSNQRCLVTGFPDENGHVVLCTPDQEVPLGSKLF